MLLLFKEKSECCCCCLIQSRVSLLISILRLNMCPFLYLNRYTPSSQPRVYWFTQLRTDGVHCRESTGTGPVNLKAVLNGCCKLTRPSFPHPLQYWYEVGMLKVPTSRCFFFFPCFTEIRPYPSLETVAPRVSGKQYNIDCCTLQFLFLFAICIVWYNCRIKHTAAYEALPGFAAKATTFRTLRVIFFASNLKGLAKAAAEGKSGIASFLR